MDWVLLGTLIVYVSSWSLEICIGLTADIHGDTLAEFFAGFEMRRVLPRHSNGLPRFRVPPNATGAIVQ